MSRSAEVFLQFGDEVRRFKLGLGEWQKIQEAVDCGPAEVVAHLAYGSQASAQALGLFPYLAGIIGRPRTREARAVLFHGLIGGGMAPNDAGRLMRDLVDERPLLEPIPTAFAVALAGLIGAEDEPAGEDAGETAGAAGRPSPAARSASPSSMPPPSDPGSARTRPTAGRSGRSPRSTTSSPARPPKTATGRPKRPPPKS